MFFCWCIKVEKNKKNVTWRGRPKEIYNFQIAGPWWSSGLERQSHDNLGMLKVKGSNLTIAVPFLGTLIVGQELVHKLIN